MDNQKNFSRDEIDLDSLMKLKEEFGDKGELNQQEFVAAFGSILGTNLSDQKLTHLFMKIDANSDGSVDWDEFTNYMFLDNQYTVDPDHDGDPSATQYLQLWESLFSMTRNNGGAQYCHKDGITALKYIEKYNQLLSASRDGVVRLWNPITLVHQSTFKVNHSRGRNRLKPDENSSGLSQRLNETNWITDAVYMSQSNRLAVSSVGNGISFFDMTTESRKYVGSISPTHLRNSAPLCMDYHYDASKANELLLIGDDDGCAHVYSFNERKRAMVDGNLNRREKTSFREHSDHIMKIGYVPDLSSMLTASLDSNVAVFDLERGHIRRKFCQHKKAVYSFTWCVSSKVIASCGLERHIILWSPYSKRSVATLHGHASSIRAVVSNDEKSQLISLSTDSTIKIWDIRNNKCIQTLETCSGGYEDNVDGLFQKPVTQLMYMDRHHCIVTGSNELKLYPVKPTSTRESESHERPLVAALYNHSFEQVISADEDANLSIWNVQTGEIISRFQLRESGIIDADVNVERTIIENNQLSEALSHSLRHGVLNRRKDDSRSSTTIVLEPQDVMVMSTIQTKLETQARNDINQSVSAMCFDGGGRRLITGTNHGKSLKIWNFSNGCMLKKLVKTKITDLLKNSDNSELQRAECKKEVMFRDRKTNFKRISALRCKRKVHKRVDTYHEFYKSLKLENSSMSKIEESNSEITAIAYMVNTLPRISGQLAIQNKYIVSVGWDRRIYVWEDGLSASEDRDIQGYVRRMPDGDLDCEKGHTADIICVCFVPTNAVATGGYDGQVILWNLDTGKCITCCSLGASVESLVYLQRYHFLAVARADGNMTLMNTRTAEIHDTLCLKHTIGRPIVALASDKRNDYFSSGDGGGAIKIWELRDPLTDDDDYLVSCAHFQAHSSRITSIDYVENSRILETFILSGEINGNISMWTLTGSHVGQFGQSVPWNLNDPKTWRTIATEYLLNEEPTSKMESLMSRRRQSNLKVMCELREFYEKNFRNDTRMPKVGEVWTKQHGKSKSIPIEVITITNIDESNGTVRGINGIYYANSKVETDANVTSEFIPSNSDSFWNICKEKILTEKHKTVEMSVSLKEFLGTGARGEKEWQKELWLSSKIGRIFSDPSQANDNVYKKHQKSSSAQRSGSIFRADSSNSSLKQERDSWYVVDSKLTAHLVQDDIVRSIARAPRSLSIFNRKNALFQKNIEIKSNVRKPGLIADEDDENENESGISKFEKLPDIPDEAAKTSAEKTPETNSRDAPIQCEIDKVLLNKDEEPNHDETEETAESESIMYNSSFDEIRKPCPPTSTIPSLRNITSLRGHRIKYGGTASNIMEKKRGKKNVQDRRKIHSVIDIPLDYQALRATIGITKNT